jgi:hypothetical protein
MCINNDKSVLNSLSSSLSVLEMIFDELYLKIYNRLERNLSSIEFILNFSKESTIDFSSQ